MSEFGQGKAPVRGDSYIGVSNGLCEHLRAQRFFLQARASIKASLVSNEHSAKNYVPKNRACEHL